MNITTSSAPENVSDDDTDDEEELTGCPPPPDWVVPSTFAKLGHVTLEPNKSSEQPVACGGLLLSVANIVEEIDDQGGCMTAEFTVALEDEKKVYHLHFQTGREAPCEVLGGRWLRYVGGWRYDAAVEVWVQETKQKTMKK